MPRRVSDKRVSIYAPIKTKKPFVSISKIERLWVWLRYSVNECLKRINTYLNTLFFSCRNKFVYLYTLLGCTNPSEHLLKQITWAADRRVYIRSYMVVNIIYRYIILCGTRTRYDNVLLLLTRV